MACVKVLLEAGAGQQVGDAQCRTPLDLAREAGHTDLLTAVEQHNEVQRALQEQQQQQGGCSGGAAAQ